MHIRFDAEKTAQAAARFMKDERKPMYHSRLMCLLYLADRAAIDRYGSPITGDVYLSTEHGPVLANTLAIIGGEQWGFLLRPDCTIGMAEEPIEVLCEADEELVDEVCSVFGGMDEAELAARCRALPELAETAAQQKLVGYASIMDSLGKSSAQKEEVLSQLGVAALVQKYSR